MRCIAITSNQIRHQEFVKRVQKHVDLDLIVSVEKKCGDSRFCTSERLFFKGRKEQKGNWVECDSIQIHSRRMIEMIAGLSPDVCFVFGAPLLKKSIFKIPKHGCINIHTGLVQHHRGVDSPYWALYEEKPETIGATLHYIDSSIDGGGVIDQSKTKGISETDSPENIFMKTCATGFDILEKNMYDILNNTVKSQTIKPPGKLYQKKDMCYGTMLKIRNKTSRLLKEFVNENYS
tara:strand:+ start:412 stop:1113 length:702 start_codon:yes stop_codon:yes gene_type:complete